MKFRYYLLFGILALVLFPASAKQTIDTVMLKKAVSHPMQYYISLPAGWSAAKKWPVLVSVSDAGKEFRKNAILFRKAAGN
ncbi:MAG TPA: hypothetical protein VGO09_03930 [Flavisolibacter sp.]|nr:hypothetical protein [Flavisolibacter sp.]